MSADHFGTDIGELASVTYRFASRMLDRLIKKAEQGYRGWDDPSYREEIEKKLGTHAAALLAGDSAEAVDVANLAMFLYAMDRRKKPETKKEGS